MSQDANMVGDERENFLNLELHFVRNGPFTPIPIPIMFCLYLRAIPSSHDRTLISYSHTSKTSSMLRSTKWRQTLVHLVDITQPDRIAQICFSSNVRREMVGGKSPSIQPILLWKQANVSRKRGLRTEQPWDAWARKKWELEFEKTTERKLVQTRTFGHIPELVILTHTPLP